MLPCTAFPFSPCTFQPNEFSSSTPFRQGPTTPQIFFGRDAELAQIVHVITTNVGSRPARIAILGPGGYGKTTLAHAVLTVDVIREHFGDTRYFVPCESVTSSGALLTELGKTLGVVNSGSDALWTRIHAALTAKASIICFDNFESPWDQHVEMKHSVEELLSKVTELHRVTVLITMRGAERPARTQWTQPFLKPLETLDHNAAKEIWQAIAGNYDEFSERLIEAVDHVPLAINILSHLSQVMPPALLWKEWNSKQTRAVQTGQEHRLSNLEYSIQLSINSGRMKANLSAKNLLGVLCILPDGLHLRHLDKFDEMLVGLDITSCLQTLLQCSLIKLNEKRYQLHPIVQHVCLNQGMLLSKHKAALENFYTTLALSDFKRVSSETFEEMMLEVNNTKAALLSLLNSNYANESRLVAASIKFTSFCGSIGDHSDKVISQAIEFVQMNSGEWLLLIQCLHQLGEIYCYGSNFEKAKEKLQEAEKLCILNTHAHSPIYGHILKNMGDTYLLQDELNDAEACYQKALSIWKDRNDIYMQGVIYSNLGNLYRRLQRLDEAITLYQSAIQCHESTNNPLTQGTNYKGLGWIYLLQSKLVEAEDAVQKALKLHEETNAFLNQGNDYQLLGSIYLRLKRLKDATAACQKAIELYKLANNALGQGNVYKILGEIHLFQGKTNDAEESFKKALELHTMANNCLGQGGDHFFLGHIYKQRGQLYDAKAMFEKAIALNKKAQASVSEKKNIEHLNAVITQMKDSSVV
jgi:tetratricopeptide (TPR) repeat protein